MLKKTFITLIGFVLLSSCGSGKGNSGKDITFKANYPDKIAPYSKNLKASAFIKGADSAVLSASADGTLEGDVWRFNLEPLGDISNSIIHVEFLEKNVVVAFVETPLLDGGLEPSKDIYQLDIDNDSDGLANIDELMFGVDPNNADTDGDGAKDGVDAFPSIAAEWGDIDGDGIGNNSDNCPSIPNANQKDTDGDAKGDLCDNDDDIPLNVDTDADDDGKDDSSDNCPAIANADQLDTDHDGIGNACDSDIDGDEVVDTSDNCPSVSNQYQDDVDNDGNGNECDDDIDGDGIPNSPTAIDNCPYVSNPSQLPTDADDDNVPVACDLDDTDSGVGTKENAIFVDATDGLDSARGTITAPLATIATAIAKAAPLGKPVYVAAATYTVSNVSFTSGAKIFGGFQNDETITNLNRFKSRDVRSGDNAYKTVLIRNDIPTTIATSADNVVIDGFYIENGATTFDAIGPSSTIIVSGGIATVERNTISGNSRSPDGAAVKISAGTVNINRNNISGGGYYDVASGEGTSSKGVLLTGGQTTLANNVITGGSGRFATGVEISDANPLIVNNTIDVTASDGSCTAKSLVISNSSPKTINNILLTDVADEQLLIECVGTAPTSTAEFKYNLLASIPYSSQNPIIRNCAGVGDTDATFTMGSAAVSNNIQFQGTSKAALFNSSYELISLGVDAGLNTNTTNYGNVAIDYNGKTRTGAYDIGAVEK